MSVKKVFPATAIKRVDALASKGALSVGCFVHDGKLIPAINSCTRLNRLNEKAKLSWYSGLTKRYLLFTQNKLYYSFGALNSPTTVSFIAKSPSLIEIRNATASAIYLFGDTTYFKINTLGNALTFKGGVMDCVMKNGRIFGIDTSKRYTIRWSGEGGIDDWTEGISGAGWAALSQGYGEILNLVVYKEKLVAIREYGLAVLSAYGTPENYKLSYPPYKLPKVYKYTACVVNEKLLFCTDDGIYSYDGNTVEKAGFELADEIESPTFATCNNGKYFLCGVSKTLKRKAVLVYDAALNAAYIIDTDANTISVGPNVFAYSDTYETQLKEGGEYSFTSGEIDFSTRGLKVLKEVVIDGDKDVRLEVSNGVISRIVGGVRGKFRPNIRGKSFKITVCGKGKIDGISAVAEVLNEV
ncbi:MAG: hypothetical protein K2O28_02070 [Clostridia bacterium]|nr:hypothetical protein [Clostridia bacterium]